LHAAFFRVIILEGLSKRYGQDELAVSRVYWHAPVNEEKNILLLKKKRRNFIFSLRHTNSCGKTLHIGVQWVAWYIGYVQVGQC
jgi:hypothetical protein